MWCFRWCEAAERRVATPQYVSWRYHTCCVYVRLELMELVWWRFALENSDMRELFGLP